LCNKENFIMQSQPSVSSVVNANETGMAPSVFSASGIVLPSVDLIRAIGGTAGIVLTLTPKIYLTGSPAAPTSLYQVYHAIKADSGLGLVSFVDPNGALFNGQPSYELLDQWQWVVMAWTGNSWDCFGN
jgi:hypothetical protein